MSDALTTAELAALSEAEARMSATPWKYVPIEERTAFWGDVLPERDEQEELNDQGTVLLRNAARQLIDEVTRLRSFIAETLPFLREAWTACFRGQEQRLLSAEERGMGRLLSVFQEVADGKPALPPGVVTTEEAEKRVESAIAWAHRLLGFPNDLRPELQEWIHPGETCADGIERADAEVTILRNAVKLAIGRQRGIPWPEVPDSDVDGLVEFLRGNL